MILSSRQPNKGVRTMFIKDSSLPFRDLLIKRRYGVIARTFQNGFKYPLGYPLGQIRQETDLPILDFLAYASEMLSVSNDN